MSKERINRIAYKVHIDDYLRQLSELAGRDVSRSELTSLQQMGQEKAASRLGLVSDKRCIELPLGELKSYRFTVFAQRLQHANPSGVSVWLEASDKCGLWKCADLTLLNFKFDLSLFPEGVIDFETSDLRDRCILDFELDDNSLEIDLRGENWPHVHYPD